MAGIDNSFSRKNEQAAANVLDECIEIASCQVGSSNTSLEKNVARKHAVFCRTIINQTSWRMARHMDTFQLCMAEGDNITII